MNHIRISPLIVIFLVLLISLFCLTNAQYAQIQTSEKSQTDNENYNVITFQDRLSKVSDINNVQRTIDFSLEVLIPQPCPPRKSLTASLTIKYYDLNNPDVKIETEIICQGETMGSNVWENVNFSGTDKMVFETKFNAIDNIGEFEYTFNAKFIDSANEIPFQQKFNITTEMDVNFDLKDYRTTDFNSPPILIGDTIKLDNFRIETYIVPDDQFTTVLKIDFNKNGESLSFIGDNNIKDIGEIVYDGETFTVADDIYLKAVSLGETILNVDINYKDRFGNTIWIHDIGSISLTVEEEPDKPPSLYNGLVTPESGDTQTEFIYSVFYKDDDNDAPTKAYIYIDDNLYNMYKADPSDIDYEDGCEYEYKTTLSKGSHDYYFYFENENASATTSKGFKPDVNNKPVLSSPGNRFVEVGNTLSFTLSATDQDGDVLTYSMNSTPDAAGVSLNSATGSFIWMPTNTEAGVYRFTFTVTDNGIQPKSDSKTVTITVFGTYEAQLSHVPSGPSYASVEIPENGNGYSYFYFMSEGGKVYHGENINLKLLRSESQIVDITGDFIEEGILRIILPASEMGGAATAAFTMPDTIKFGGSLFVITNSPITFNAQLTPCEYFRVWNIYGSGSAGVTGTIGSGGVSATVSAAKLSVKGQGGLGLKIERDEESNITLERRMETDFSIRTELPSVNYIVGGVEIGEKGLDSKTLIGQKFRFADAIYNDDVKNIAQTGFILEALSFGGAELSPIAGSIIKASINTLNSTGNVNTYFNDGLVENYWGLGAEGSARSSSSIDVGENFKLKFAENVSGYAVHSKYFTGTRQLTDGIGKLSNWYNIHNGDGRELIQASNFNFADYNLDFTYDDKVELNLDNFGIFDNNTGSEIFYSLNLGSSPNNEKLYVKMTGGGNTPLFGSQKETYYGTAVEFPSSYNDIIRSSDTGLPGIFGEEINIRLGPTSMAEDAVQVMDDVLASSGSEPLLITTIENRAIGKELNLEIDMESILGEDYTMPLGIKADYYDETVFPKKITEIYPGRKNYLLLSTDYIEPMAAANLESTLEELLSETLPLIKNALDNLIAKIEQTIQKNIAYVVELQSTLAEKVASIAGIAEDNGTWYCSVFSPENPRIVQKPFAKPQFKNVYISNGVLHKRADAYHENGYSLETAQTTLILLSNAIDIHFLAEGGTEYVDTLESPIDLKMIIYDEQLEENDFANADKDRIKIYYYNSDSLKWAYIGGMRSADTVSASISQMGTYALGIEAGLEVDNIVPEVYDTGPGNVTIHDTKPEIYAKIRDNRYGSGIDLSKTFIILNGDTLNTIYNPTIEKLYYQITNADSLTRGTYNVTIIAADFLNNTATESFSFFVDVVGIEDENHIPRQFNVYQNYPNPFNPNTTIKYTTPRSGNVEIHIYDVSGNYICTLEDRYLSAGTYEVQWDGRNSNGLLLSSGVYFYQVKSGNSNIVKKMQLIK